MDHVERMREELTQLRERIEKAEAFKATEKLDEQRSYLLVYQISIMRTYAAVLEQRISLG